MNQRELLFLPYFFHFSPPEEHVGMENIENWEFIGHRACLILTDYYWTVK